MAEVGIGIGIEAIVAVIKHCFDLCSAAKQYPEDAARIHLRLAYVLARVPEWSKQITSRASDPGCMLLVQNLHVALTQLTICVEALGSSDKQKWRNKIKLFLDGKKLLNELRAAELKVNQALLELNHDNTSFIANHIALLSEKFDSIGDMERVDQTLIVKVCNFIDSISSGNVNNPKETLRDVIAAELEEWQDESLDDRIEHLGQVTASDAKENDTLEHIGNQFAADMFSRLRLENSLVGRSKKRIGIGGMAKIYRGTYNGDDVAIKVIDIYRNFDDIETMPEKIYEAEVERVCKEAVIMKQFSIHSNVVDVYGYTLPDEKGTKPFIVMELMHSSLHKIIHEPNNLDFSFCTRAKLIRDIASALEFLHLQHYVHHDVKPANVLVDEFCTIAKLTDFGVTKQKVFLDTTFTQCHSTILTTVLESSGKKVAGTRAYQAPELLLGNVTEVSRRAEIYSFGVTIWECLSRKVPHYMKEDRITELARHSTRSMLEFPLQPFLSDSKLSFEERASFVLLERVAYLCLSKFRPLRPNSTQILQYFDGMRQFNPDFLMTAPLSKWHESSIHNPATDNFQTAVTEPLDIQMTDGNVSDNAVRNESNNLPHQYMKTQNAHGSITDAAIKERGLSNINDDEETSSNVAERNVKPIDSTSNKATLFEYIKQNWKLSSLFALLLIIGASIVVAVKILQTEQRTEVESSSPITVFIPTTSPIPKPDLTSESSVAQAPSPFTTTSPRQEPFATLIPVLPTGEIHLPSAFPTISPRQEPALTQLPSSGEKQIGGCFATLIELRTSIIDYLNGQDSVRSTYGGNINDWCVDKISDFTGLFYDPTNTDSILKSFNEDISKWKTSSAVSMKSMFQDASLFSGDISSWDVSSVTDMSYMFAGASTFNSSLSLWDVSSVTSMSYMFASAREFNGNVSLWNVAAVRDMYWMFQNASKFNGDISLWNVSSVTSMSHAFDNAVDFNVSLNLWDVSSVVDTSWMFKEAFAFDGDVSSWVTTSLSEISGMFFDASAFNRDLSSWNVSSVTGMSFTFGGAKSFDGNLQSWDVSSVIDMSYTFIDAYEFSGDISSWDVSSVTTMASMFDGVRSFNGDISSWNVSSVVDMSGMFYGAAVFNTSLCAWGKQLDSSNINVVEMFAGSGCISTTVPDFSVSPPSPFCHVCV